jgi:hypothetical protein
MLVFECIMIAVMCRLFVTSNKFSPMPCTCGDGMSISKYHTQDGRTALTLAAANGQYDCMCLLLAAGAEKEARDGVRSMYSL